VSAVVLRELVAMLGLQVDEKAFKKADEGLSKVKKGLEGVDGKMRDAKSRFAKTGQAMGDGAADGARANAKSIAKKVADGGGIGSAIGATLGKYLGGAAVVAGLKHMTDLASSADETNNVLREVFGPEGEAQVHTWAAAVGESMGRSKYAMEASAASLGAMLEPMTGNAAEAQEMSQKFAELAVDLGSFFNASDEDALAALKSGITGEAEPLKKFGIVMNDATLAEYAHTKGITKKLTAMSNAEKTELRYGFILSKTTKAQGDAARTSDSYANKQKAFGAAIDDLATDIGKTLLPVATKMLRWALASIQQFGKLTQTSNILKAAFVVLGVAMLYAFGPAALTIAAVAAGLAVVIGVLDDLITWFEGGDSLFGDLLNQMFGEGASEKALAGFKEAIEAARGVYDRFIETIKSFDWEGFFDRWGRRIREFGGTLREFKNKWDEILYEEAGSPTSGPLAERHNARVLAEAAENLAAQQRKKRSDELHAKVLAERAAAAAEEQRRLSADTEANRGTPGFAYASPYASYSGGAVTAPLPPPASSINSITQGSLVINNFLPPNANVSDYTRQQQRAADIQLRRAKDALERTAP